MYVLGEGVPESKGCNLYVNIDQQILPKKYYGKQRYPFLVPFQ